jgi:hypothetical protein
VSRLRWTVVALLVASTALFAVGVIAERSSTDAHSDPASVHVGEGLSANEAGHTETAARDTDTETNEAVLGVNIESTPLLALAVILGLGLAVLTATRLGRPPAVLLALAVIALAWVALDVREVVHQLDESRTGIAIIAIVVAVLHLTVALLAGAMAVRGRQPDGGAPARRGTIPA